METVPVTSSVPPTTNRLFRINWGNLVVSMSSLYPAKVGFLGRYWMGEVYSSLGSFREVMNIHT